MANNGVTDYVMATVETHISMLENGIETIETFKINMSVLLQINVDDLPPSP